MLKLFLAFTLVPILEIIIIVEVGKRVGTPHAVGLILLTGALGAVLAAREGLGVASRVRVNLDRGTLPVGALEEGAAVLAGGLLLLTPGFLTDGLGFLLLIPPSRRLLLAWSYRRLRRWVERRQHEERGRRREW